MSWEAPVAIIGAGLGVINAAILGYQIWSENRTRIGISVDLDYFGLPGYMKPGFFIEAHNYGKRNVTLQAAEVLVEDGMSVTVPPDPPDYELPYCLMPVSSHAVWMDPYDLGEKLEAQGMKGIVKISGSFRDQLGNRYKSAPFEFRIDDWLVNDGE